jgi:hypothetical protein
MATSTGTRLFPEYRANIGIAESILGAHVTAAVHLVNAMKNLKFPTLEAKEASKKASGRSSRKPGIKGGSRVEQSKSNVNAPPGTFADSGQSGGLSMSSSLCPQ